MNARGIVAVLLLALGLAAAPRRAFAQQMVPLGSLYRAIAAERTRAGLPALLPCGELEELAGGWARHIAEKGKLIHRSDLRRIMEERGWWSLTENLHFSSRRFETAEVMASWLTSRQHRRNLLDPEVTHIGLGSATDGGGRSYTVFNAARLAPPPPEPPTQPVGGLVAPPGTKKPSPIPAR